MAHLLQQCGSSRLTNRKKPIMSENNITENNITDLIANGPFHPQGDDPNSCQPEVAGSRDVKASNYVAGPDGKPKPDVAKAKK